MNSTPLASRRAVWVGAAAVGVAAITLLSYFAVGAASAEQGASGESHADDASPQDGATGAEALTGELSADGAAAGPDRAAAGAGEDVSGSEPGMTPSIPLNTWVGVGLDEADELTPYDLLVPEHVPEGISEDLSVAIRVLDVTGDGQGDLHSVVLTLAPEGGPRDEAGHGNVQVNLSEAPPRLPPMITDRGSIDVGRDVDAYGASAGHASMAAWVEGDVLIQLSGELEEAALRDLTRSMREGARP